jgi:hypothetical protein
MSLVLSALATGCAHSTVRAGPPDPLRGARHFAVEGLDFSSCRIGSQPTAEDLAGKGDLQRPGEEIDKEEIARLYLRELTRRARQHGLDVVPTPAPGPGYFVLRPMVTFIESGIFTRSRKSNTQMQMKLVIADDQGGPLGDVSLAAHTLSSWKNPSSSGRLRQTSTRLGAATARYLVRRLGMAR